MSLELYIHIPFCVRKCGYCDFLSFPCASEVMEQYLEALIREIHMLSMKDQKVSSIFIGGGTPSLLPAEDIGKLLSAVREAFVLDPDAEISIEANPGTLDPEGLCLYRESGINRLSIGCQSADDNELKRLGRIHTFRKFQESFRYAREAGFDNINADLMSAIPGQSVRSWEQTLRSVARMQPEHISAYSLIIEEGTPFYDKYHGVTLAAADGASDADLQSIEQDTFHLIPEEQLPGEETERRMYEMTEEILSEYGYHRYEISNYARSGRECRHNIGYWTGVPYLGLGLGASSFTGSIRFRNTENLHKYIKEAGKEPESGAICSLFREEACGFSRKDVMAVLGKNGREETEFLEREDQMAEFMILGLRMTKGVSAETFREKFGCSVEERYSSVLRKYTDAGLLQSADGRIFLTPSGISVSNRIMADFL
ncbi:MAG: radical SAM family heme chaperone HemW [Bilifractor sp.]